MNSISANIKNRLIKGSISMLALRGYTMLLMLVLNGSLSRWMPPSEFAKYVVGSNLLIFLSLVGMAGLNQSMVKLIAGVESAISEAVIRQRIQKCFILAMLFSLAVTLVAVAVLNSPFNEWLKCDPEIILGVIGCSLLVSFHKLLASAMRSVHAISSSSILEGRSGGPLANTAFFVLVAGVFIALGVLSAKFSFWVFFAALGVTIPIGLWMLIRAISATSKDPAVDTKIEEKIDSEFSLRMILLSSSPFLMAQVSLFFATEFDIWLASAYATADDTTLYGCARRLVLQVLAPVQILTLSASSSIAQLHAQGAQQQLQRMLGYTATIGTVVTIPVLIVCFFFSSEVMGLVFGDFYRAGGTIFSILAIGQGINCLTGQCSMLMMMSGKIKEVVIVYTIVGLILLTLGTFLVKGYGINGLAVASAISACIQNILLWALSKIQLGIWTHPTLVLKKPKAHSN